MLGLIVSAGAGFLFFFLALFIVRERSGWCSCPCTGRDTMSIFIIFAAGVLSAGASRLAHAYLGV